MARIALIVRGSLGDMLPMIYVGKGLHHRGHEVRIIAPDAVRGFIEGHGLACTSLKGCNPEAALTDFVKSVPRSHIFRVAAHLRRLLGSPGHANFEKLGWLMEHLEWCDLVGVSYMDMWGAHFAEKLQRPCVTFHPTPTLFTRAYAFPLGPLWWQLLPKPGFLNLATHRLWRYLIWSKYKSWVNQLRTEYLDIPSLKKLGDSPFLKRMPRVITTSKVIFPRPSDWVDNWHLTDYPFDQDQKNEKLPDEVEAFLVSGPAPIFFGFSSTPIIDSRFWTRVVLPAIERLGCRAIVGSGWSNLPDSVASSQVLVVGKVSFRELFPRVACVIHACGIGTLSEAVISGTPSVGIPVFGEQKLIATQAYRQGLIPRPCPLRTLSPKRLANLIQLAISDPGYRKRTRQASQQMGQERGILTACEVIERYLAA